MKEKVKVLDRGHSWTVIDMELGHRICNSYQDSKGIDAPSHVHDALDNIVGPCSAETPQQAFRAMKAYRQRHSGLDLHALETEVRKWK